MYRALCDLTLSVDIPGFHQIGGPQLIPTGTNDIGLPVYKIRSGIYVKAR